MPPENQNTPNISNQGQVQNAVSIQATAAPLSPEPPKQNIFGIILKIVLILLTSIVLAGTGWYFFKYSTSNAPISDDVTATVVTSTGGLPNTRPSRDVTVTLDGSEELVIPKEKYNCPEYDGERHNKPDMPVHAYRDANGKIRILATNSLGLKFIADSFALSDLERITQNCTPMIQPLYESEDERLKTPAPETFSQKQWLTSTYTLDGETIYAFVHNEFHGEDYNALRTKDPMSCKQGGAECWYASITKFVSTDMGDSFAPVSTPPNHYLASSLQTFAKYVPGVDPLKLVTRTGTAGHTNVVKGGDNFYYMFTNILSDYGPQEGGGMCLLRSDDLTEWYYWDGKGFSKQFENPYIRNPYMRKAPDSERTCVPVDASFRTRGIAYNPEFNTYIAVSGSGEDYYYATSRDLITWSEKRFLRKAEEGDAVVSIIDHDSPSRNFEIIGSNPYLYIGRDIAGDKKKEGDDAPRGEVWRVKLRIEEKK